LDFKTREKRDNGLAYLLEETNLDNPSSLKAVEVLDSKRSDLMQLSDLYLGVIRYGYELGVRLNRHEIPVLPSTPKKQALYLAFRSLYQQLGNSKSITVFDWSTK
jgi:hypothetical protein